MQHFTNISRWLAAGYDEADVRAYLRTALQQFNSSNIALDLRVDITQQLRCATAACGGW